MIKIYKLIKLTTGVVLFLITTGTAFGQATTFNIEVPIIAEVGTNNAEVGTNFAVTVTAVDGGGAIDANATPQVTLSVTSGASTGTLTSAELVATLIGGTHTWSDLQYNAAETITLTVMDNAGSSPLTEAASTDIVVGSAVLESDNIIITELADPNNNAGLRYIELYNAGDTDVNFTTAPGWKIVKYNNGSLTSHKKTLNLTETITAKGFYIIAAGAVDTDFETAYGVVPDLFDGATDHAAGSNGNDNLQLLKGTTVIDVFGIPNENGIDTNHEFEDGRAERKATVATRRLAWDVAEWNIDNDGTAFPGNGTRDAPADFDPGTWIGTGSPLISLDIASFSGDFGGVDSGTSSSSSSFSVSGSDLTDAIAITSPEGFSISDDNAAFVASITLAPVSEEVSSTMIYVRFDASTVQSYTGEITLTSSGASNKVVGVSGTSLGTSTLFFDGFSACSAGVNNFSVASDKDWECTEDGNTGNAAEIVGFRADVANDDWLITSQSVDLTSASNATLTFFSWTTFTDTTYPTISLKVSSDYAGSGNPTSATWMDLSALFAAEDSRAWFGSGDVDLSSLIGESSVYVAFQFTSSGTGSGMVANWRIDDILIEDRVAVPNPSFTVTKTVLTTFLAVDNGGFSADTDVKTFEVTGENLTANITATASAGFQVSLEAAANFMSSVDLVHSSGAVTDAPVYVRFAPSSGTNGEVEGNIVLSTDVAVEQSVSVTGDETGNPAFTVTETALTAFLAVDNGGFSADTDVKTFDVTGENLTANITVTASAGFQVSKEATANFMSIVALEPTGGALTSTVHVRFAPGSGINGEVEGNIVLSTDVAVDQSVSVTGTETGNTVVVNDLYFSEYIEPNGGNEKAFEIYNGTGADVDLSAYMVRVSHNGLGFGNDGNAYDLPLTGTLVNEEVYVIYNNGATNAMITTQGDLEVVFGDTNGGRVASYNGNDALGLFKNGTLIDLIGDPDDDSGAESWSVAGVMGGSKDHTLLRKGTITTGNTDPLGSFGTDASDSEWTVLDENTFDNLGSHDQSTTPVMSGFTLDVTGFNGEFGSVRKNEFSSPSSYSISGAEITGDVTITVPMGFEVSLTSDFSNRVGNSTLPLSITPTNEAFDAVKVYVRFAPNAVQSFSGDLEHTASGYEQEDIPLTGVGTEAVTGIGQESLKYNISVYPNPSEEVFHIAIPESFGTGEVKLVSLDGAVVQKGSIGKMKQIETSNLRSGIYLLQILNATTVVNYRVVVK